MGSLFIRIREFSETARRTASGRNSKLDIPIELSASWSSSLSVFCGDLKAELYTWAILWISAKVRRCSPSQATYPYKAGAGSTSPRLALHAVSRDPDRLDRAQVSNVIQRILLQH